MQHAQAQHEMDVAGAALGVVAVAANHDARMQQEREGRAGCLTKTGWTRPSQRRLRAQELLDNELLSEAFTTLEDNYNSAWRATVHDDVAGREKLFLAINIVGKVRDHLNAIVANGKLAQAELKELAQTSERRKRFGICKERRVARSRAPCATIDCVPILF